MRWVKNGGSFFAGICNLTHLHLPGMGIITGRYQQRFGADSCFTINLLLRWKKRSPGISSPPKETRRHRHLKADFFLDRQSFATDLPVTEITIASLLKQKAIRPAMLENGTWALRKRYTRICGFDYSYYFAAPLPLRDWPGGYQPVYRPAPALGFSGDTPWAPVMVPGPIEGRTLWTDTGYPPPPLRRKGESFHRTEPPPPPPRPRSMRRTIPSRYPDLISPN